MASKTPSSLGEARKLLSEHGLEEAFLKATGLDSLDELSPLNFRDVDAESAKPKLTTKVTTVAAPTPAPDLPKSIADARTGLAPSVASDILSPFLSTSIVYSSRKVVSTYYPSAYFMYYMLHIVNSVLVDNFYFKRHCPDYHPYILRLYYGVIFWIQVLRAGAHVNRLTSEQHQFLVMFLTSHHLESLPIVGPLVPLFKTLCASQPEIPTYGQVTPSVPDAPGPSLRSDFISDRTECFSFPNVPGIFALLEDLNSLINGATPSYPKKGQHIPVVDRAKTFGHHAFPAEDTRSNLEKWALVSAGLEYPCEADQKLNEAFAERYGNFDFPATGANDNCSYFHLYMSMDDRSDWFNQVKDVAASAAQFFEGSGTLADCSPSGIVSNQLIVNYNSPSTAPTTPTKSADKGSLFPFSFHLTTTARSLPPLAESMAALAQTHVRFPANHPYLSEIGTAAKRNGPFWDVRPIERSNKDESSYLALYGLIKKMMKTKF